MKAYCLIREGPHYRRDAFVDGLQAAGCTVLRQRPDAGAKPGEVLVIWNRYGDYHRLATQFEKQGGRVIVAENPYFGLRQANGEPGGYALSLHGHNGSGEWFPGDESRWNALQVTPAPWQQNVDGHLLICGQRGIGSPSMASPPDWHNLLARKLAGVTKRRIVVRPHPEGPQKPKGTLEEQMAGAWAVFIWSSSGGIAALVAGIPVFYAAPSWVCERGASELFAGFQIEQPFRNEAHRLLALRDMAWAQWSLEEISRGVPFVHLLKNRQGERAA